MFYKLVFVFYGNLFGMAYVIFQLFWQSPLVISLTSALVLCLFVGQRCRVRGMFRAKYRSHDSEFSVVKLRNFTETDTP